MNPKKHAVAPQMVNVADMSRDSEEKCYEIYDLYYFRVNAFIKSIVKDEWVAEDLTQETFIRAFKHFKTLKDHTKLKAWLFRIAHNLCNDYFRGDKKKAERTTQLDDKTISHYMPKQERKLEQQEMSTCIQNHFLLLPETLRPVLWLFDVAGFTQKEISKILDISVENVKVRLHRARNRMKLILQESCRFERDERNVFVCTPNR